MATARGALSAAEIVDLARRHTLYDWQAQSKVDPIPVLRAEGVYFWDVQGRRYLDLSSQLMGVNVGHGDRRVIDAITRQAERLAYISPFAAYEERALLGRELARVMPGDMEKVFFTLGGSEANENALRIARAVTGRHKVLARYRSYHGATSGTITLTGDPRRWPNEPGIPGVVHVLDPYHGPERPVDDSADALRYLEETIQLEGPETIAAFFLEPVTGTNGVLIPPDGYLQGVRELCDRHGILMVCDEVMSGFGRTGEWFAVDHWGVVPDLLTMAKGLTSCYAPLGAVGMRPSIAAYFDQHVFYGGLTYNSHPLGVAAALANLRIYREDGLIERAKGMGERMRRHHQELLDRHPSVGLARNIGLFGLLELVRDRRSMNPMAPFNGTSEQMQALYRCLLDRGVSTFIRWHTVMTSPPLCITEGELQEAFEVLDEALVVTDRAMVD